MIFIHFLTHRPSGIGWQPWLPTSTEQVLSGPRTGTPLGTVQWGCLGEATTEKAPDVSDSWLFPLGGGLRPRIWDVKSCPGDRDTPGKCPRFAGYTPSKLPPGHFPGLCCWKAVASPCQGGPGSHAGPRRRATQVAGGTPRWGPGRAATFTSEDCLEHPV